MTFIEDERGNFINSAHIKRITPIRHDKSVAYLAGDGGEYVTFNKPAYELASKCNDVILPCPQGWFFLTVYWDDDEKQFHSSDVFRLPVLAWKIGASIEPITPDGEFVFAGASHNALLSPSGSLSDWNDETIYGNEQDWLAAVKKRIMKRQDEAHARNAVQKLADLAV